jgi:hypothetical protein
MQILDSTERQKLNMNDVTTEKQSQPVKAKVLELLDEVLLHDGFGDIRIEVRILKRKQKEVIVHCGKQYRYVVDTPLLQTVAGA